MGSLLTFTTWVYRCNCTRIMPKWRHWLNGKRWLGNITSKVPSLTRNFMDAHKVPLCLWDYAQEHALEVHNHTAWKALNWLTPYEAETGDTPDCSHLLYFDFYQPVWYWDNPQAKFPKQKRKLGRWLGIARNIGQALCFHILAPTGAVIARSTVKAVDEDTADVRKTIEEL